MMEISEETNSVPRVGGGPKKILTTSVKQRPINITNKNKKRNTEYSNQKDY
jgi:hypothetical protein